MTATATWLEALRHIIERGTSHTCRDLPTMEVRNTNLWVDMNDAVVNVPERRLNYKFMAAEALSILNGSNRVSDVSPLIMRMREFSDDGYHLSGAYGPPFIDQLPYVIRTLAKDHSSRQAVISLWRPSPHPSKNIPCTLSIQFLIRDGMLHAYVAMRSSDVWLGLPYDIFCFTCMAAYVGLHLVAFDPSTFRKAIHLGGLHITSGSQHLYMNDYAAATDMILSMSPSVRGTKKVISIYDEGHPDVLKAYLGSIVDGRNTLI